MGRLPLIEKAPTPFDSIYSLLGEHRVPRIARIGPYRFFFYSNEGIEPPHVHVRRDDKLAKFWMQPVALAGSRAFSAPELRQVERIIQEHEDEFLKVWHEYFGN